MCQLQVLLWSVSFRVFRPAMASTAHSMFATKWMYGRGTLVGRLVSMHIYTKGQRGYIRVIESRHKGAKTTQNTEKKRTQGHGEGFQSAWATLLLGLLHEQQNLASPVQSPPAKTKALVSQVTDKSSWWQHVTTASYSYDHTASTTQVNGGNVLTLRNLARKNATICLEHLGTTCGDFKQTHQTQRSAKTTLRIVEIT